MDFVAPGPSIHTQNLREALTNILGQPQTHCTRFQVLGITSPEREKVRDMFCVLSKFAPSSWYTQQRLGKKNPVAQKTKNKRPYNKKVFFI